MGRNNANYMNAADGSSPTINMFLWDGGGNCWAEDVDFDGIPDLVVANEQDRTVSVLLGAGDGSFGPHLQYGTGDAPRSMALSDLDGDGDLDLSVANYEGHTVSVLLNRTIP